MPSSSARCSQLPRAEDKLPFYIGLKKLRDFVNGKIYTLNEAEITFPDIKIKDTDDVLQKTIIRISNKPFSELSPETLKTFGDKIPSAQLTSKSLSTQIVSILGNQQTETMTKIESINSNLTSNESNTTTKANNISKLSNKSHTIHHLPEPNPIEPQQTLANSQIILLNPTDRSTSLIDLLSSQQSTIRLPTNSSDDCLYLRYERQSPSASSSTSTTANSFQFSFIIDDYSSTVNKQLRYVSINDL